MTAKATATSFFKMVFLSMLALTILLLLLEVGLVVVLSKPNGTEEDLIRTVDTGWQVGFSGLLGLLAGRAL